MARLKANHAVQSIYMKEVVWCIKRSTIMVQHSIHIFREGFQFQVIHELNPKCTSPSLHSPLAAVLSSLPQLEKESTW